MRNDGKGTNREDVESVMSRRVDEKEEEVVADGTDTGTSVETSTEEALKQQIRALRNDLSRRERYRRSREQKTDEKIASMQEEIDLLRSVAESDEGTDVKMGMIRRMHRAVMNNVNQAKDKFSSLMESQERDLWRTFTSRMSVIESDLRRERERTENGVSKRFEMKHEKLRADMKWAAGVAKRLERSNIMYATKWKELVDLTRQQKEDRDVLIRQLVAVKKENARIRKECLALRTRCRLAEAAPRPKATDPSSSDASKQSHGHKHTERVSSETSKDEEIARLRRVVQQQRRRVEMTEKKIRRVREQYMDEMSSRDELKDFLGRCIDDVRGAVAEQSILPPGDLDAVKLKPEDRERALAMLLSKEHVIKLLYKKSFGEREFGDLERKW